MSPPSCMSDWTGIQPRRGGLHQNPGMPPHKPSSLPAHFPTDVLSKAWHSLWPWAHPSHLRAVALQPGTQQPPGVNRRISQMMPGELQFCAPGTGWEPLLAGSLHLLADTALSPPAQSGCHLYQHPPRNHSRHQQPSSLPSLQAECWAPESFCLQPVL